MCIYDGCPYDCLTKSIHHSKFATMRRNKVGNKSVKIQIPSPKVNWELVNQLNLNKPIIRKKNVIEDLDLD